MRFGFISGLGLALLFLIGMARPLAPQVVLARQSTDVLRRTPTPTPTVTPMPVVLGWRGQIVSNVPYATSGNGSIVRVRVFERADELITLTHYDIVLTGLSGTKPEYGPHAAEFAPVAPGRWTVSLPNLGASTEIEVDGYNLIIVEFAPYTPAEATVAAQIPATSTPLGNQPWEGRLINTSQGPLPEGAILRVIVQGRTGHLVQVSTPAGFVTQNATGAKEELGPDTAEFAPLTSGRYTITPAGLNASLTLDLTPYTTVVVEFRPVPERLRPTATFTPIPASPTPRPSPTPTPPLRWIGAVLSHERSDPGKAFATIAVRVSGMSNASVTLTSGDAALTCTTGTRPEYGDYTCEFGALSPGLYTISVAGLEPVIPIAIGQGDFVLVEYRRELVPPGPLVWLGRVVRNSSQPWPGNGVSSAIAVHVQGRRGQVVSLQSGGGWQAWCYTGIKSEHGDDSCEFGGLGPGVYRVSPMNIPAEVRLYVDGIGFAEVVFEALPATATPLPTPTRLIGAGASPIGTPVPITAATPTSTATGTSTRVTRAATPTATRPPLAVTAAPMPTLTPTPTPGRGWVGRVVQDDTGIGIGTIVVRIPGVKDQPVVLRSGPWVIRGLTGSKPEYGENAVEFGGLNQGDYSIELEGLGAALPVHLQPGGFLLVEFIYDLLPTPTPTPQSGVWVGAVTRNTSSNAPAGAWSTIIVKIPGLDGLTVTLVSEGGFATTCLTGTKPEYGTGACEVGGLWPGTYRVTPQGLGPSVDVWLDGQGSATIEFWIR